MTQFAKSEEIFKAKLTDKDFVKISSFITQEFGIKLPPVKKVMLQSRLQKRLRALNYTSYSQYIEYLFSKQGMQEEVIHMIDVVTTNKTDFFREANHFDYLTEELLPEYLLSRTYHSPLKIWSAGCSSGEEPYTLSIVLSEYSQNNRLVEFQILATDISTQILEKAITAIYPESRIEIIPLALKRKYFLRSKDRTKATVRVGPELRRKVSFRRINLMDASYNVNESFDIIFCRNVLIYFDRANQEKIITKLCSKLKSGGYFFLGHSESIMNMNVPLVQIKPTIYKRI